jgi:hypothetical protein
VPQWTVAEAFHEEWYRNLERKKGTKQIKQENTET